MRRYIGVAFEGASSVFRFGHGTSATELMVEPAVLCFHRHDERQRRQCRFVVRFEDQIDQNHPVILDQSLCGHRYAMDIATSLDMNRGWRFVGDGDGCLIPASRGRLPRVQLDGSSQNLLPVGMHLDRQ